MKRVKFDRETQIRKLPIVERNILVDILEVADAWKQVMARIKRTPTDSNKCPIKYTSKHISMIEAAAVPPKLRCADIFLHEWGCSGRKLPSLGDLLDLLKEANLLQAEDYVVVDLLGEPRPLRPVTGIAAEVLPPPEIQFLELAPTLAPDSTSIINMGNLYQAQVVDRNDISVDFQDESYAVVQQLETVLVDQINDAVCGDHSKHISYSELLTITNGFDGNPIGNSNGRLLGEGGFGSVYLGIQGNNFMAVKRLNKKSFDTDKLFQNEVETLKGFHHPNLLRMIGYSSDGPANCLVYEYMSQGDLHERLSCKGRWEIALSHQARFHIALGASKGLKFLHEDHNPPLVHRDIKSANILLDKDLSPKIGDFGLARLGDCGEETTTVIGTDCYMSPEAMSGVVTVKSDVFSFGVVMLELLSSLSPMETHGDALDLVYYVREVCEQSIAKLLDKKAGTWSTKSGTDLSEPLFQIAQECLEDERDLRPFMSSVVQRLQSLCDME